MVSSSWPQLFAHPLFRKGWEDHLARRPWTEEQGDNVVYIYGRLMAAESRAPLPGYSLGLTAEMVNIIEACPAMAAQLATAQWLQAGGDPDKLKTQVGTKQGDEQ